MNISAFISGIFQQIGNLLQDLGSIIFVLLPNSPFVIISQNTEVQKYLGYVNYFIPVSFMISTLELWLVAVGLFYAYQLVLRFINAIE